MAIRVSLRNMTLAITELCREEMVFLLTVTDITIVIAIFCL